MFRDLIGVPYKAHGRSKEEGFDCYGLVIEMARRTGKNLKDAFREKTAEKLNVKKIDSPEPYCLVAIRTFGKDNHVGMYIGRGMVMHCSYAGVVAQRLSDFDVSGFYRITENGEN